MERDPLKISAVLADPTRFSIYQALVKAGAAVSAADVARQFDLHANVARMHLNKLADIGLLTVEPEKGGRGRPGLIYTPTKQGVSFSFPSRDYELLSELLCETLASLGPEGYLLLAQVGQEYGRQLARRTTAAAGTPLGERPLDALLQSSAAALAEQGMEPEVAQTAEGSASITLSNCGFHSVADRHPELVCHLCREIVQGVVEENLDSRTVKPISSLPHGDHNCTYIVELPVKSS